MQCLKKCCCFELKTGVLIIAVLGWILTLCNVFGSTKAAVKDIHIEIGPTKNETTDEDAAPDIKAHYLKKYSKATTTAQIVISLMSLACGILLVLGVFKKSHYLFLPWMIFKFIEYLLTTLVVFIVFIAIIKFFKKQFNMGVLVCMLLLFLAMCAICWFMWVVVYSYYVQIKSNGAANPTTD